MGRDPSKPKRVFPSSNFESSRPDSTDGGSGTESHQNRIDERKRAARMVIHEGEIKSIPDRSFMILVRGEYNELEKSGEIKRPRRYLVCSDLSPQATYAMEWVIGTVLRDGDKLWVTRALDKDDEPHEEKDLEAIVRSLAEETKHLLKRTRLQVYVTIEVVAAKTSKHMITEMVFQYLTCVNTRLITLDRQW
jgi:hypothetical protein